MLAEGHASVRGVPARRVPLAELGALRGEGAWRIDGGLDPDTGQGVASAHWHQGAGAAEVAVDEETGRVEVVRLAAAVYAGQVVDPVRAELQQDGSLVMGLGSALFESLDFAGGQIANANLSDYAVPTFADVPPLDSRAAGAGGRRGARARRDGPARWCPPPSATPCARSGCRRSTCRCTPRRAALGGRARRAPA